MKKIDKVVIKETVYITVWTIIFSVIMQAVYLLLAKWDITVLFGNLLGAISAVLNFLLMGITVQNAVTKDEKDAKNLVKLSQTLRYMMLMVFCIVGFLIPTVFNFVAVLVPLLFPGIAIKLRMISFKKTEEVGQSEEKSES